MALLIRTHLKLARISIKENRTRSFLTCLGIAIGIASIILILSLTGSIKRLISDEVSAIGDELIVVRPSSSKDSVTSVIEELTSSNSFERSSLAYSDVAVIKEVENVVSAAPIAISTNTVKNGDNVIDSATILGTTPDFINVEPLTFRYGTFLNEKNRENSVVIGHMMALNLFNTQNPVGKTFQFRDNKYIIVGVLEKIDKSINFDNVDFDNAIIMDLETLDKIMGYTQIQQINIKASSTSVLEDVSSQIRENLKNTKSGDTNFSVAYGDEITHPASTMFSIVSGMLALVAGISLIVGGVGVMNIMLVSVSERTHEIGIRKAVGASHYNILMQFMFESLILSSLGGVLGVVLGYIGAFFVSIVTPFVPYINFQIIAITLGTALIVGVIFGIYPALKAASKNPIESLKHYR